MRARNQIPGIEQAMPSRSARKHRQELPIPVVNGWRAATMMACAVFLTSCKTFSPDGGMDVVAAIAGRDLKKDVIAVRTEEDAATARSHVARLLKRPLTADAAVQI